jgi:hypothetical protein
MALLRSAHLPINRVQEERTRGWRILSKRSYPCYIWGLQGQELQKLDVVDGDDWPPTGIG